MIPRLPGPETDPVPIRWSHLGWILLLALGLRCVALGGSDVIGADSYRFLSQAQSFEEGLRSEAIADSYHPLTSILIASVNSAQKLLLPAVDTDTPAGFRIDQSRRERAGWGISLIAGLLLVWLSMDLCSRLFPRVPPIAVGLLTAAQPYFVRASVDIMSDMIYLACFGFALRAGVVALTGRRWIPFAVAGFSTGLAYLARPEGALLIPGLGAVWLLCRPWPWKVLLPRAAIAAACVAVLILPYALAIDGLTGKKDIGAFVAGTTSAAGGAGGAGEAGSGASLALASLLEIFHEWLGTAPEPVGILAIVGLIALARDRKRELGPILYSLVAVTMGAVLLRLLIMVEEPGYLSRRHVYLMVFLALPFAGAGVSVLTRPFGRVLPRAWREFAFPILLALIVAMLVPKAVSGHRSNQRSQRLAAEYILAHGGLGQRVYSSREKIWYYAGARFKAVPPDIAAEILAQLAGEERAWLAFYRERFGERVPKLEEFLGRLGDRLTLEASWLEAGHRTPRHLDLYLYQSESKE